MTDATTHFGRETVATELKASRVRGVFDTVASRYDLMNDLMSGGLHRLWKAEMVSQVPLYRNLRVLDLAGGTGDISFRIADACEAKGVTAAITVSDINAAMLAEGQRRAIDRNRLSLDWLCADAESLPVPDHRFDVCTMAFGIRNVTRIPVALREIHRVLKPGGLFLCLEFSQVTQPLLRKIYDAYSFHVIPRIGAQIVNDPAPYEYLVESIRNFPNAPDFAAMLTDAGFQRVSYQQLTGGVVAIHKGWKR